MVELLATYDNKDDIPEEALPLEIYTEREGKWELTGVKGMKTEADVRRVQTALEKERKDHKGTKERLKTWGDLNHEEVLASLDRIPELEAAAGDKLDDDAINELVEKRIGGRVKPLQRKHDTLAEENAELRASLEKSSAREIKRTIDDAVSGAAKKLKVLPTAIDDALLLGGRVLKPNEDGTITTEDGLTPEQWLEDLQTVKTHWWPPSQGGGAGGGGGGLGNVGQNPFSNEHWLKPPPRKS
jgi:hypothetical protein